VRDGYYAEVRQQRRSSLPQQRLLLKQASIAANKGSGQQIYERESSTPPILDNSNIGNRKDRKKALAAAAMLQQGISFDMNI
jgi:hypothetical protein